MDLIKGRLLGESKINMRSMAATLSILAISVSAGFVSLLSAQEPDCAAIAATASMARATSTVSLTHVQKLVGNSYRAEFVFAYRSFQLHPASRTAANRLLNLIPKKSDEQATILTLGDGLCSAEKGPDMTILSKVRDGVGREFARAVVVSPELMAPYIAYSLEGLGDPHSDYAMQMKYVCQRAHKPFVDAIQQLPKEQQGWFVSHVMKPGPCKPLALPEVE